jgi:hypothetical protein
MLTDPSDATGSATERHAFDAITSHLRPRAGKRRLVLATVLFLILAVGGGLLTWGANFGKDMVHDQLAAQRITFPEKGSEALDPETYPGLQQYAGQPVDSGPKAKAYANEYIAVHIKEIGGGKTYSELSTASRANPTDTKLAGTVQTVFRGETLRGLLLYAWGWSVVANIAALAAWGAFIGAAIMLAAIAYEVAYPERS